VAFALYFDEDSVNRALIRALRARGMDVRNAVDAGHAGSPDRVQLEHATADGRVLFTYNVGTSSRCIHSFARRDDRMPV
jgi:hypothetical protein